MKRAKGIWLKTAIAVGFALAGTLLIQSFLTHRYIVDNLLVDHLTSEAGHYVSGIERAARELDVSQPTDLHALLEEVQHEDGAKIAWLRMTEQDGTVLAATNDAPSGPLPKSRIDRILMFQAPSVVEQSQFSGKNVLVVTTPFRFRFPDQRVPEQGSAGRPQFKIAEVGLYVDGFSEAFRPLREDLAIAIAASLGLIAAMLVAVLRFPAYVHGKEMEQQLSVARRVQEQLLPQHCDQAGPLQLAAACLPAYEVGGDYYDAFPTRDGRAVIVVGDVSGKGLPAALVMSLLHGTVRSTLRSASNHNLAGMTSDINELLFAETPPERYVTFFWSEFDAATSTLRYVNAGHWPPLLVRGQTGSQLDIRRLESSGPPIGLLPDTQYVEGKETFQPGDLLIAYSDGVVEATSLDGADFGEQGVIEVLRNEWGGSAEDIKEALLGKVTAFTVGKGFDDDLTVVAARVK